MRMVAWATPEGQGESVRGKAGAEDLGRLAFDKVVHSRWSPAIFHRCRTADRVFEISG